MNKKLNKVEKLIAELCPEGVEVKKLGEVCVSISAGGDLPDNYLKGQKVPSDEFPYPIYSNGTEEKALYGFTDCYKVDSEAVTISARGTIGYHTVRNAKFTPIVRLITLIANTEIITSNFLNCILDITEICHSGGSIPQLTVPNVKTIKIPIPPLAIQQEIVKILDTFTTLEAELEAELEARKKQYEYYRDELLTFGDDVEWKTLGEVCEMKAGKSISASDISSLRSENNVYPCIGGNGLRGYVDSFSHSGKFPIIGRQGALCGNVCFAEGDFYATEHAVVVRCGEQFTDRFLYHLLLLMNLNQYATGGAQPGLAVSKLEKIKIPIPPLAEQHRIVAILNKFDALVNDISIGLPAELNARRNQYEYYRNKLLTFKNSHLREGNHPALTGTPPQEGNEKHPSTGGE